LNENIKSLLQLRSLVVAVAIVVVFGVTFLVAAIAVLVRILILFAEKVWENAEARFFVAQVLRDHNKDEHQGEGRIETARAHVCHAENEDLPGKSFAHKIFCGFAQLDRGEFGRDI
jgi:hypothetical protein